MKKERDSDSEKMLKSKVVVFHPALAPYRVGIFNALFDVCQLDLVFLKKQTGGHKFDQAKLLGALLGVPSFLPTKFTLFGRGISSGIKQKIDECKPDVVITSEFSITTWMVAFINIFKKEKYSHIIWTDDNVNLIAGDALHRKIARMVFTHLADGWFFISKEVQVYYQNVVGVKQLSTLIPVIHNEKVFRAQLELTKIDERRREIINEHELHGKHVLIFVGRLVKLKNLDRLIKAFQLVSEALDNSVLVIVGEGEERGHLGNLVNELGMQSRVKFVGRYEGEGLLPWYRIGNVFALASFHECFGAVVNEALIAGMPAVVSTNVGARSLIVEGKNGTVADASNIGEFAQALLLWLKKMGPLGKEDNIGKNLMNTEFADAVSGIDNLFQILTLEKTS